MAIGGAFLRVISTIVRSVQLCASLVVLGIFSYFLAVLSHNDLGTADKWLAVEGMSGAAALYGIFAVLFTVCLGGVAFFAALAVVLDVCFIGCFIAVAWFTRSGADSCSGNVNTPLGSGLSSSHTVDRDDNNRVTISPSLGTACRLNKAVFAVSIVNIFLFVVTAILQVAMAKHHRRDKRFGPSPANGYTSGRGSFWKHKKRNTRDAELATAPRTRPSHETEYTGSTVAPVIEPVGYNAPKYGEPGYRGANF